MNDLISLLVVCSAIFFVIVTSALGLGTILVWCGVL